jgi:quinohemoprotein ethanol dehydrogenase
VTHQLFYQIVLNGIYQGKGMGRWDDVLSAADAQAIHAYLVDQAWQLRAETATAPANHPSTAPGNHP